MIATLLLALGAVLIFEGLVYALAPHLVEDLLEMIRSLPIEQRRVFGFLVVGLGVLAVWAAYLLAG